MKQHLIIVLTILISLNTHSQDYVECSSFFPEPNEWYVVSGWVKQDATKVTTYTTEVGINIAFDDDGIDSTSPIVFPFTVSGNIIDGWQRIIGKFQVPSNVVSSQLLITIELFNNNPSRDAWFDDIRVYPLNGTMKSFVYDEDTQRLMAELDENNYATYYEYDQEGGLVRVKKETEKGVYTIQETRSSTKKND
ncbi:hypothetical protein [Winogradskyella sp.]|uniref:hypothetical protein n=1 Tax=Winogradskyella sp. TaxID=1883156 RepID=UPI003BABC637